MTSRKQLPNIIICGTSGVGKTRLCQQLCSSNPSLKYVSINDLAKQNKFVLDYDAENQCHILNDDAINDYLDEEYFQKSSPSGLVVDYHSAGIIPDTNQIQGIFVLRCNRDQLSDRLKTRNYSKAKLEQTLESEAFEVCLNEAREAYDDSMIRQLNNMTEGDLQNNLTYISKWIDQWPFHDMTD